MNPNQNEENILEPTAPTSSLQEPQLPQPTPIMPPQNQPVLAPQISITPPPNPVTSQPPKASGSPVVSLILGVLSIIFAIFTFIGLTLGIVGLIFGIKARKGERRSLANLGIILSCIGLVLSIVAIIFVILNWDRIYTNLYGPKAVSQTSSEQKKTSGNSLSTRCFSVTFPDNIKTPTTGDFITVVSDSNVAAATIPVHMVSAVNDCNTSSAWEGVEDFPVFKVNEIKTLGANIDEDAKQMIGSNQANIVETTKLKVNGYDAVKIVIKDDNKLNHVIIGVRGPKDSKTGAEGFVIRGYYYNLAFRDTFDQALASLKWKL